MEGFSDTLLTSSLSYAWGNFRARADYRYRADYIEGLDADIDSDEWFGAREAVDAEFSYRFNRGLVLFASGANLTNRAQVSYTGSKVYPEDISYNGRKYTVGLEFQF